MRNEVKQEILKITNGSTDIMYVEKHKKIVEEYLDKNFDSVFFDIMVLTLNNLAKAQNYTDIKIAYKSANLLTEEWSGAMWSCLESFISKYAKYGEFFYELSLNSPLSNTQKEKLQPFINDRKEFKNDKTEQIKKESAAYFEQERIKSIKKEIENNNAEINSLQKENERLEKLLTHDDKETDKEM